VPSDGERAEPLAPSRTHVVKPGETLWRISKRYGSSPELVAKVNRIANPAALRAGQRLVIPAAGAAVLSPRLASPSPSVWNGVRGGRVPRGDRFVWPVQGYVSSGFGIRDGAHHTGLDIRAPVGTVVRAAESGRVVHANAKLEGYGNMIIIRHSGRFSTVYAHNHRNLVRPGDFVEKGQVIAEVGQTGRASAPHLHFEVRRDGAPDDPLDYLP
jgi:murein DD-endopeptidase MepM/ murein hydrolase activator NlpD